MEWFSFGPFLWRCRCAFLNRMKRSQAALMLGDGDGRFTARLLRENLNLKVDAVDASRAMLNGLRQRADSNINRVRTHCSDARISVPARREHDLVIMHFFLDCLTTTEVVNLAMHIRRRVSDDAIWVISEFAVPSGWYGRLVAEPLIHFLYLAFGWLTGLEIRSLPDHSLALTNAGLSLRLKRKWLGGLLISELWHRDPQFCPFGLRSKL
jgi:hypothetical protein